MLVDSPYCGDWMASTYSSGGKWYDYHLFLSIDGSYERRYVESQTPRQWIAEAGTTRTGMRRCG